MCNSSFTMSFSESLAVVPSEDLKREIVQRFWRRTKEEIDVEDYTSYFQYYYRTCEGLYLGLHSEADALVAQSHDHILIIVEALWNFIDNGQTCHRPKLRKQLEQKFNHVGKDNPNDQIRLNNSINLALRLWLTLEIRDSEFALNSARLCKKSISKSKSTNHV